MSSPLGSNDGDSLYIPMDRYIDPHPIIIRHFLAHSILSADEAQPTHRITHQSIHPSLHLLGRFDLAYSTISQLFFGPKD